MPPAAVESKPEATKAKEDSKEGEEGANLVPAVPEKKQISNVIVHPLVLLSVVDHFNRMGKVGHSRLVTLQFSNNLHLASPHFQRTA